VFRSTNFGQNWSAVNSGLPESADVSCFAVVRSDLFAGTYKGAFLTTNHGQSWTAVNSGLPESTQINCFLPVGTDLFAGTSRGLFVSANGGAAWTAVNEGLPNNPVVTALASSGSNLFAGVRHSAGRGGNEGDIVIGDFFANDGVFLSVDKGKGWAAANKGLPGDIEVRCFAVSGSDLLVALVHPGQVKVRPEVGLGVYLTSDGGANWAPANAGLPAETTISCLLLVGADLFAGTRFHGVWRAPLASLIR
jgi:hypothetical protein